MRYVFIAGLEHSGTTLTEDLLARRLGGVGLGEIAGFLSPEHMRTYLARWGTYPDARICSCGEAWESCPFWGELAPVWGLVDEVPAEARYRRLFARVRALYGGDALIVDSSKSLPALRFLLSHGSAIGTTNAEIRVLLAVKDARSFAASAVRKRDARRTLAAAVRALRWWCGANREYLSQLEGSAISWQTSLYEHLCFRPDAHVTALAERLGLERRESESTSSADSHIAIGNKDYLNSRRGEVHYDSRWFHDSSIQLAYLLLPSVRRLNRMFYAGTSTAAAAPAGG